MDKAYRNAAIAGFGGWLLFFVVCPLIGLLHYSGTGGHIQLLGVAFIVAFPYLLATTVLLRPANFGMGLRVAAIESSLIFLLAPLSLIWQEAHALGSPVREYAGSFPVYLKVFALFAAISTFALAAVSPLIVKVIRRLGASRAVKGEGGPHHTVP